MADLSALLGKEASAEIEAILSEARTRASEIVEGAKREAETLVSTRERASATQREASLVRARSSAQLEAASLRLRAQFEGVQAAFDAAAEAIRALPQDRAAYAPVFRKLLEQALAGVGGDEISAILVAEGDRALAEEAAKDLGLKAPIETSSDVSGGVYVKTTRNNLVENTLLGRLGSLRDELASEVSSALFKTDAAA